MTELVSQFSMAGLQGLSRENSEEVSTAPAQDNIAADAKSLIAQSHQKIHSVNIQPFDSQYANVLEVLKLNLEVLDKVVSNAG